MIVNVTQEDIDNALLVDLSFKTICTTCPVAQALHRTGLEVVVDCAWVIVYDNIPHYYKLPESAQTFINKFDKRLIDQLRPITFSMFEMKE